MGGWRGDCRTSRAPPDPGPLRALGALHPGTHPRTLARARSSGRLRRRIRRWSTGPAAERGDLRRLGAEVLPARARQQLRHPDLGRTAPRRGRRHLEPRRLRRGARARSHGLDGVRPAGLGHPGQPRGEAAHVRPRVQPRLRPGQAAGGRAQRAIARRDPAPRRDLRGDQAPRLAARRRHLAQHGGVLGAHRGVAARARRSSRPGWRPGATGRCCSADAAGATVFVPPRPLVKFLAMGVIWGASFLFIKIALEGVSFGQVAWARIVLGASVLVDRVRRLALDACRASRSSGCTSSCSPSPTACCRTCCSPGPSSTSARASPRSTTRSRR